MNNMTNKPGGEGETGESPHIWLRYATQFTTGGRTHTIEMGIPVPPGASAEMRAKLIREAQAGMDQLSSHVESRVTQMLQRNQRPQSTTSAPPLPSASSASKLLGAAPPASTSLGGQATHIGGSSPLQQAVQRVSNEEAQKDTGVVVPPTRMQVGASMPLAPGLPGDANSILSLTQFLRVIKGSWGLSHQQAKDLLQVRTLDGMNLRDALERLQLLMTQKPAGSAAVSQKPQEADQPKPVQRPSSPPTPAPKPLPTASARPAPNPIPSRPPSPVPIPMPAKPLPASPAPGPSSPRGPSMPPTSARPPIDLSARGTVSDKRPPYRFDEEDDQEEDEDLAFDDEDESEARPELSAEELLKARNIISKMKDVHGSSAASPGRLTVLQNVVGQQISQEQLQELMQAFWGTTTPKKLKADQVEELISWAKEDEFVEEVEAVLILLEEE
jgi:hypothetical protein